jgi:hypothetical protein
MPFSLATHDRANDHDEKIRSGLLPNHYCKIRRKKHAFALQSKHY